MIPQSINLKSILIVEDDSLVQDRLLRLVAGLLEDSDARIEAVPDLATARARLQAEAYSLALVDVHLPDGNGVDLIAWMRQHASQVVAVVVSAWAEEETILRALQAGAIGYLLKDSDDEELRQSLNSLRRGGAPIDPVIARRILTLLPQTQAPSPQEPQTQVATEVDLAPPLSEREREILNLVAQGFSNREIAELVALSKLTIECHTRNIYRKLAVGSRTAAVFEARALGLLN